MAEADMVTLAKTGACQALISKELRAIKEEEALTDFTIKIGLDRFPCQKLVLALHSPVLKDLVMVPMAEASQQECELNYKLNENYKINKDTMKSLLDFMYYDQVSVHKDQLVELVKVSDYLQMPLLKEMCLSEIQALINPSNVITYLLKSFTIGCHEVERVCYEKILLDFNTIVKQDEFLSLSFDDLESLLTAVFKIGGEAIAIDVLTLAADWVEHDEDIRMQELNKRCTYSQSNSLLRK